MHAKPSSPPPALRRRRLLIRGVAAAAAGAVAALRAQETEEAAFPQRPVRLIIPFPAGGPTDRHMRLLAELAGRHLGQPVQVENRPGAGGTLGPSQLNLQGRPDGYLISQYPGAMLRLPHLQKVAWHPIEDFSFITGVSQNGFGLVVRADAPWADAQQYIAAAREAPGRIDYGSAGVGSSSHLLMEQLARASGVRLTHVPFRGASDMLQALLGGHLMSANDASGWEQMVDEGKLRLLLVFDEQPPARWPQVPTARALGWDVVSESAHGIVGPRGMPSAVVQRLAQAFAKAMAEPAHRQLLAQLNQRPFELDGESFRRWAQRSYEREGQLIERLGLARR